MIFKYYVTLLLPIAHLDLKITAGASDYYK